MRQVRFYGNSYGVEEIWFHSKLITSNLELNRWLGNVISLYWRKRVIKMRERCWCPNPYIHNTCSIDVPFLSMIYADRMHLNIITQWKCVHIVKVRKKPIDIFNSYSTFLTAKKQPSEPVNVLKYLKCNPLHERI